MNTGMKKVAAFLLSLDTQTAAAIFSRFSEDEIAAISQEMLAIRSLKREDIESVQTEFLGLCNDDYCVPDARAAADDLLRTAIGEERRLEMLGDQATGGHPRRRPFESLAGVEPRQLADILKGEHPQTIALILSYLKPQQSGIVLSRLPEELHSEVVVRMTRMENAPSELLMRLDQIITGKAQAAESSVGVVNEESKKKMVAEILNVVGKSVRKSALEKLAVEAPEQAREIEELMFVFDDFARVDDASIRKIIMEIDNDTLALALKTSSEELRTKFFKNLSKRAAASAQETLDNFGPKPLSEVEAAQHEVMRVAHNLDEQGQIALRRGEEDQLV